MRFVMLLPLVLASTIDITLNQGKIRGNLLPRSSGGDIAKFVGVPFAAPPVGKLRWEPPAEVAPWTDIKSALNYGNSCPQGGGSYTTLAPASEDCLYLNMWIPRDNPIRGAGHPVMIFFYGGSFDTGSAMFPLYDGMSLADTGNTIVIAANYRLNVFGFLGSDKLRASDNSTGNFGIQDQRQAMKFIVDNAANLGADASKIMIFGESAGGGSVSNHLVRQKSWPYFTRAGMESGPLADWVAQNLSIANARFDAFAAHAGCSRADDMGSDVVACLRSKNMSELLEAKKKPLPHNGLCEWAPVLDGVELGEHPIQLLLQGKTTHVPLLFGTNKNEGTIFVEHLSLNGTESDFATWLPTVITTPSDAALVHAQYPCSNYKPSKHADSCWWAASTLIGDSFMTCPARRTAQLYRGDSFLYHFEHEMLAVAADEIKASKPIGVSHASELPLVFGFKELLLSKNELALSQTVRELWTSFADSGRPVSSSSPDWPLFNASDAAPKRLVIDIPMHTGTQSAKEIALCNFWDSISPYRDSR